MAKYTLRTRKKLKLSIEDFVGQGLDKEGFSKIKINDEIGECIYINIIFSKVYSFWFVLYKNFT